jgi:hypothetical protein
LNQRSQVEELFFTSLGAETAPKRAALLDLACRGDAELRRQVERLLQAHSKSGEFLAKPAVEQLTGESIAHQSMQWLHPMANLAPRADVVNLKRLVLRDLARVSGLAPLEGLALEQIRSGNFRSDRDAKSLRAIPTLTTINDLPAAEFWKQVDASQSKTVESEKDDR